MEDFNIKKILKKLTKLVGGRGVHVGRSITHPSRDWKIILVAFTILNIIMAVFSTFLFLQINKGEIFVVDVPIPSSTNSLNREELQNILSFFEEKKRAFVSLKINKPTLVDPSQ